MSFSYPLAGIYIHAGAGDTMCVLSCPHVYCIKLHLSCTCTVGLKPTEMHWHYCNNSLCTYVRMYVCTGVSYFC